MDDMITLINYEVEYVYVKHASLQTRIQYHYNYLIKVKYYHIVALIMFTPCIANKEQMAPLANCQILDAKSQVTDQLRH